MTSNAHSTLQKPIQPQFPANPLPPSDTPSNSKSEPLQLPTSASLLTDSVVCATESQQAPSASPPNLTSTSEATPSEQVSHQRHHKWKHNQLPPPPSNSIVLKNLDYNITQATLEEVVRRVTGGANDFININLIDDKITGAFRGMAFVNFNTIAHATTALTELSKMVINNRKVIAEYRRMRTNERKDYEKRHKKYDVYTQQSRQTFEKDIKPEKDANGVMVDKRTAFFARRDTAKKDAQKQLGEKSEKDKLREEEFRSILKKYDEGDLEENTTEIKDLLFDATLTAYERKTVHQLCAQLNLGHISRFDDDGNRSIHVTKDPERAAEWEKETAELRAENHKLALDKKRKARENGNPEWKKNERNVSTPSTAELHGINWFKPRAAMNEAGEDANGGSGIRAPTYKTYIPPRNPKGPDGTIGFKSRLALVDGNQKEQLANADTGSEGGAQSNGEVSDELVGESAAANPSPLATDPTASQNETAMIKPVALDPSVPAFSPSSL